MSAPGPIRSRCEALLRRAPVTPLRDIVEKRPSEGENLVPLDGLRGVAILIVIASHTKGLHLTAHGGVGVWLFFALSAFLLTLRFADHSGRRIDSRTLVRYFRRRITRILPLYYFVLFATFLPSHALPFEWLVRHLLFVRADGVYWSIPQELLFYLLLPVMVVVLEPLGRLAGPRWRHGAMAILLLAVAGAASLWLDQRVLRLNGNSKWLPFYLGVFASGMAFAYLYRWGKLQRLVVRASLQSALRWTSLALLLGITFSAPYYHRWLAEWFPVLGTMQGPLGWNHPSLYGLASGALIWSTLACPSGLVARAMSSLVLRAFGLVSFGMYLLHMPVLKQIKRLGVADGTELFIWTVAATWVIASVTYALIERPFLRPAARD